MAAAYEPREQLANALIHGVGLVGAVIAGTVLVTLTAQVAGLREVASVTVFALSAVLLFTASTLYHAIPHEHVQRPLKVFDHCAIFLLIAGTYTPFTLIGLRGGWGWGLFATVWTLAVIGIGLKLFYTGRFRVLSTLVYVAMGWIVVVAIGPLVDRVPHDTIGWLVAGGVLYTLGAVFYLWHRLPYNHAIWHVFVLAACICHFVAVFTQVL
ncbi:MAG TPA: hemolysin III family protein [Xanthomonadales bacterium]|nr:hemolysin III family protein [Xanthomonadales bacterium]